MKNKTTIFISHRLGSTKLADEILVIDNGRIIEKGTHEMLISKRVNMLICLKHKGVGIVD